MKQTSSTQLILNKLDSISSEITSIRTDVGDLKKEVSNIKTDVRRLEVLHEEMGGKIDHIREVVVSNSKEIPQIREHNLATDDKFLFHERRIGLLEKKLA